MTDKEKMCDAILDSAIGYVVYDSNYLTALPLSSIIINEDDIRNATILLYLAKRFDIQTNIIKLDKSELEAKSKGLECYLWVLERIKCAEKLDDRLIRITNDNFISALTKLKSERDNEIQKLVKKLEQ